MTAAIRLIRAPRVDTRDTGADYADATFLAQLERFGAHRQSAGMCLRNSPEWQHHMDLAHADLVAIIAAWRDRGAVFDAALDDAFGPEPVGVTAHLVHAGGAK